MAADVAEQIGIKVKSLMRLVSDVDPHMPEEAEVELLIYEFRRWVRIQTTLLLPALDTYATELSEPVIAAAEKRFAALELLEENLHLGEGADAPYTDSASKYIAAVKYHLIVDAEDIIPLAMHIPSHASQILASKINEMDESYEL